MTLENSGFLPIGPHSLEYKMLGPRPDSAPTIVMLHEGLGCVGLWGDFLEQLQQAGGCGVFVYSRAGYGKSSSAPLPRPLTYMQDEAREALPALLDAIGFRRGLLLGHGDGASIATIYAGTHQDHRVGGLILMAPHFFTEDEAPDRKWDITETLGYIRVPILIVQGEKDQDCTVKQIEAAKRDCYCPVEVAVLPGAKHSPHREAPDATLKAISGFVADILRVNEWEMAA